MNALISGTAGVALLVEGSKVFVLRARSGAKPEKVARGDLFRWLGEQSDFAPLADVSLDEVSEALERAVEAQRALVLVLAGLDATCPSAARAGAIVAADSALCRPYVWDHVTSVLHAAEWPAETDLEGATALCSERHRFAALLQETSDKQLAIRLVRAAWDGLSSTLFSTTLERDQIRALMVRAGAFRQLSDAIMAKRTARGATAALLKHPAIRDEPLAQSVLQAWGREVVRASDSGAAQHIPAQDASPAPQERPSSRTEALIDDPSAMTSISETAKRPASSTESRAGPRAGDKIDQFRIKRLIGKGAMGHVYLARDHTLGRLVALKLVRPALIQPNDLEAFMLEARATARLSHPNIVVVHEVGQYEGSPYIAFEYLDGQSLDARFPRGKTGIDEVLRIGGDIGRALEHAHLRSVVHRDLKPSNVVIPKDGRLRVVDFGLAAILDSELGQEQLDSLIGSGPDADLQGWILGTPAYMAPEQWRSEPATPSSDIWALGVMIYEWVAGERPYQGIGIPVRIDRVLSPTPVPKLPASRVDRRLVELVASCLSKDPRDRPGADEVVARLDELAEPARPPSTPRESPFRGLQPFDEVHAGNFFGRDRDIAAIVERLRSEPIMTVIGPSGAGKTSLLHAGVIPRLREQSRVISISVRPGAAPFRSLAKGIAHAWAESTGEVRPPEELTAALRKTPGALNLELNRLAEATEARVVLIVDQLEELETRTPDPQTRSEFAEALAGAADDVDDPARLILSLRDDFLGRVANSEALRYALDRVILARPMLRNELRDAIVRPIERTSHRFEDGELVDEIITEAQRSVAPLPLLQFACSRLWGDRNAADRVLTRAAFRAMGGVGGALAQHADATLDALPFDVQEKLAKPLLLQLVGPDGTRRAVTRSRLLSSVGSGAEEILERLVGARLVVSTAGDSANGADASVELAHDSLTTVWGRLRRWLDDTLEERLLRAEIVDAAALWERRGKPLAEVWTGSTLAAVHHRLSQHGAPVLPGPAQEFLRHCDEEDARLRKRARTRRTYVGSALVAVTVASMAAALVFWRLEAETRRRGEELRIASADIGRFELNLSAFDWDPETLSTRAVAVDRLPDLSWTLYEPSRTDPNTPGAPFGVGLVSRERLPSDGAMTRRERVEARGGAAWLEIRGRGEGGARCGPSWLELRALPGYHDRESSTLLEVRVPTCSATEAEMIDIPGGPFFRSGPGEPSPKNPRFAQPEERLELPGFAIDRTEISNAAFRTYAEHAELTGRRPPKYPNVPPLLESGLPDRPVTGLDAASAAAFCAFMGKRLPTTDEWEKAARGGEVLGVRDGQPVPNPFPRRNLPWATPPDAVFANLAGDADGFIGVAPVTAFPEGASPYGVLNMSGNVWEWTASAPGGSAPNAGRVIRGGDFETEEDSQRHWNVYENTRDPRYFAFSLGARCVRSMDEPN